MWMLLLLASIAIGATFLRVFRFTLPKFTFWITSAFIGLSITAYAGLALSYVMGFTLTSQLVVCAFLIILSALAHWRLPQLTFEKDDSTRNTAWPWLTLAGIILFLIGIFTLTWSDGNLFINNRHNYGDIRLHLSYIMNFLYGQNIPVENPIFAGTPPSYPFLINFLSAQAMVLGLPMTWTINGMTVLGFGFIATMIWHLCQQFFNSKSVATWAIIIFFMGGGLGIVHLIPEWGAANWSASYWTNLTHDFSLYQDKGFWFSNMVIAFLSTQRSLLLGMPLTLFILSQLFFIKRSTSVWSYAGLGLLMSMLPLIHISSAIIVALYGLYIGYKTVKEAHKENALQDQLTKWAAFALPAGIIGLYLIHTFIGQTQSVANFFRLSPVWMEQYGPFIPFWIKNAGILLITNAIGFWWLKQQKNPSTGALGFSYVIFLLFNFVILQPWEFDNAKYLIYWFVFACMVGAYGLMQMWKHKHRSLTVALIILLLASGTTDLVRRIVVPEMKIIVATAKEWQLAQEVRAVIPPKAYVLTYGSVLNPIVDYSGRRMIYGDNPWLWSHGIDHEQRYADIQKIYSGSSDAPQLLKDLNVDYIVVSENERRKFDDLNVPYFVQNYDAVFTSPIEDTTVYKAR